MPLQAAQQAIEHTHARQQSAWRCNLFCINESVVKLLVVCLCRQHSSSKCTAMMAGQKGSCQMQCPAAGKKMALQDCCFLMDTLS